MHPLIEHLKAKGAAISGSHQVSEIQAAEACLSIRLSQEFFPYFASFRECQLPDSNWDFLDIPKSIERTLEYRKHYRRIYGAGFEVPIESVFAFCDYLIDTPTYFVVAEPANPLFGFTLGTHSEGGWIVGKDLSDFRTAFEHDWEIGIIMNEG